MTVVRLSPEGLKALALDIVGGRVFGSWMLAAGSPLLPHVFQPFNHLPAAQFKALLDGGMSHVWEYVERRRGQLTTGHPVFVTMHVLHLEDYRLLCRMVNQMLSQKGYTTGVGRDTPDLASLGAVIENEAAQLHDEEKEHG